MSDNERSRRYIKQATRDREYRESHCGGRRLVPIEEDYVRKSRRRARHERGGVAKSVPAQLSEVAGRLDRLQKMLARIGGR